MIGVLGIIAIVIAAACVLVAAITPFVMTVGRRPKPYIPPVPKGPIGASLNIYQVAHDTIDRMQRYSGGKCRKRRFFKRKS